MITVKLSDATVSLGGDFQRALAFVKSFDGRRFDGQTKAWTLPSTSLLDFGRAAQSRFPFDVLSAASAGRSGQHVTRYGNKYSAAEWDARRERDAIRPPAELVAEVDARRAAAEQALLATLRSMGMDDAMIARLRWIDRRFHGDFNDAAACGHIKFSSAERQAQVEAAFEAYLDAVLKADDVIEDYRAAEERRIDEKYGIY